MNTKKVELETKYYLVLLQCVVLVAASLAGLLYLQSVHTRNAQEVHQTLSLFSHKVQDSFDSRINSLYELAALVQSNPEIQAAEFSSFARMAYAHLPGLRSLQLAKNNVVSHVYPQTSNFPALGHDLLHDPERSDAVKRAIALRSPVSDGPLTLRQGGIAIIIRLPIFLPLKVNKGEEYKAEEYQWGLATVILDWDPFFKETGLADLAEVYALSMRKKIPVDQWGPVFLGDEAAFSNDPIVVELHVVDQLWQMALQLKQPSLLGQGNYLILAILILALVMVFFFTHNKSSAFRIIPVGFILAVFASIFLVLLLSITYSDIIGEQKKQLNTDLQTTRLDIRSRLKVQQDFLKMLARERAKGKLHLDNFDERTELFLSNNKEILNIIWTNSQYRVTAVSSLGGDQMLYDTGIVLAESKRTAGLARELRQAVYTRIFSGLQGVNSFEVWLPVFHQEKFQGFIAATYAIEMLIESSLSKYIHENYETQLVIGSDQVLERFSIKHAQLSNVKQRITMEPPGHGVSLQMQRYVTNIWTVERIIYSLLLLFSTAAIIWCLRRLKTLYESLEHKVKERTIELERINQELMKKEQQARLDEEKIRDLANHDTLTGLASLRLARSRMESVINLAKRQGWKVATMFVDLDGFKQVNDTLGHDSGDALLKEVANRLSHEMRDSDTVARIGGDEFLIIQTGVQDTKEISVVAERLLSKLAKPFLIKKSEIIVGASIGIAIYPDHASDAKSLLKRADEAMYQVKRTGKNNYIYYQQKS